MRKTPNYFKFRQWLGWAMKDDPLGNEHFHADDVYMNNLIAGYEIVPTPFILSYGAHMLDDARQYFKRHSYSSKTPVFFCGLDEIEHSDPECFENMTVPDFSTLEKTMLLFQDDFGNAQIFFYAVNASVWQNRPFSNTRFICSPAPSWFGSQFNMVYSKALVHLGDYGWCIWRDILFYHSDDTDFFPYEMNQWIYSDEIKKESE